MLKNDFLNKNIIFCVKIHVLWNTSGFAQRSAKLISLNAQKFAKFAQKIWSVRGNPKSSIDPCILRVFVFVK